MLQDRVEAAGVETVGSRYFEALRSQEESDGWIVEALWTGEEIDPETHLDLVFVALAAAVDDGDLWLLGDGPIEEGLWPRPGMQERLKDLRATHPRLRDLWRVMARSYVEDGLDPGVWAE